MLSLVKVEPSARGGMSMAELMIAIAILSIALFGLVRTQLFAIAGMHHSKEHTLAVLTTHQVLHQARCEVRENFGANIERTQYDPGLAELPSLRISTANGPRPQPDPAPTQLRSIQILATWTDRTGAHRYQASSLVGQNVR